VTLTLELKSGEEIELYELAIQLVETLPLRLHVVSKAERGFMLVSGEHPQPVKAPDLRYSADARRQSLRDCVRLVWTRDRSSRRRSAQELEDVQANKNFLALNRQA